MNRATGLAHDAIRAASSASKTKRAVLYLRVSTPSQVNTDYNPEGISIPAQREAGERKAAELQAKVVNEFVEPGRTATSIDKRPVFQEMIAWVKAQKDIDYVIVYHFNRIFRNSIDAALTKRDLSKMGVRIVSTILDMGDGPESQMVETIIHAVDQYQSQANGADVAFKMEQKAKSGGTSVWPRSATAMSGNRSTAERSALSPLMKSEHHSCSRPLSCTAPVNTRANKSTRS